VSERRESTGEPLAMMSSVREIPSGLQRRLAGLEPIPGNGWLAALRADAIGRFREAGIPTTRDEDWKYTSLKPLETLDIQAIDESKKKRVTAEMIAPFKLGGVECCHLVFVDGRLAEGPSTGQNLPEGVRVQSLARALETEPEAIRAHLARGAVLESTPFVALNTALMEDGAYVCVPRGREAEIVIHLLFISTASGAPTDTHPRNLIVIEESARATLVEDYVGFENGVYFTNPVTEVVVGENAELEHHKLVRESDAAFHIGYLNAHLARDSRFTTHGITLGGRLVRNNVNAVLDDEGITCTLNGLVVGNGEQHLDNQTRIIHQKPRCESHENYKAILDDRARGVFNGKIYVAKNAQKTDAKQSNHALLLTREAEMDSKPELEIYADDVKCTHGATVGRLDRDALFYLRSRGMERTAAENLLTFAFASDVVERIGIAPIRRAVETMLYAKLPRAREIRESS